MSGSSVIRAGVALRADRVEASLKLYLETRGRSSDNGVMATLSYLGHVWSPADNHWMVKCHTTLKPDAVVTLYVSQDFNGHEAGSHVLWDELVEILKARKKRDRRAAILNDTPGNYCSAFKLYFRPTEQSGEKNEHHYHLGPGPCGRTVRALKVEVKDDLIRIHQFCEDSDSPDVFTYKTFCLTSWRHYHL